MLNAVLEPFGALLRGYNFKLIGTEDMPRWVKGEWASDHVRVTAAFEPGEEWGSVMLARNLPATEWGSLRAPNSEVIVWDQQPYWTKVDMTEVLREREVRPRSGQSWPSESPEQVRAWAELAAADLQELADLLRGQNLTLIDELIQRRPHHGVPGLDFPLLDDKDSGP